MQTISPWPLTTSNMVRLSTSMAPTTTMSTDESNSSLQHVDDGSSATLNGSARTHQQAYLVHPAQITSWCGMLSYLVQVSPSGFVLGHVTIVPATRATPAPIFLWPHADAYAADTPFEDGTFKLVLTFEESYPNKPPHVKFLSRMFHPNVYNTGELCLDILQNRWSPTYDVAAILTSIQSLLHDPNPNRSAALSAAAFVYLN